MPVTCLPYQIRELEVEHRKLGVYEYNYSLFVYTYVRATSTRPTLTVARRCKYAQLQVGHTNENGRWSESCNEVWRAIASASHNFRLSFLKDLQIRHHGFGGSHHFPQTYFPSSFSISKAHLSCGATSSRTWASPVMCAGSRVRVSEVNV
jgi:hypothetical protein